MIVSVASGKGGTGKTTVAVNLALSLTDVQFLDCDVEEPNAHLFLKPRIIEQKKASVLIPQINLSKCHYCGVCQEVCAYHAIAVLAPKNDSKGKVLTFPHLCHSCGACFLLCPQKAIEEALSGFVPENDFPSRLPDRNTIWKYCVSRHSR